LPDNREATPCGSIASVRRLGAAAAGAILASSLAVGLPPAYGASSGTGHSVPVSIHREPLPGWAVNPNLPLLSGVACDEHGRCLVVNDGLDTGYLVNGAGSAVPILIPSGTSPQSYYLSSAACAPKGGCLLGGQERQRGNAVAFAAKSSSGPWHLVSLPSWASEVDGISCPADHACVLAYRGSPGSQFSGRWGVAVVSTNSSTIRTIAPWGPASQTPPRSLACSSLSQCYVALDDGSLAWFSPEKQQWRWTGFKALKPGKDVIAEAQRAFGTFPFWEFGGPSLDRNLSLSLTAVADSVACLPSGYCLVAAEWAPKSVAACLNQLCAASYRGRVGLPSHEGSTSEGPQRLTGGSEAADLILPWSRISSLSFVAVLGHGKLAIERIDNSSYLTPPVQVEAISCGPKRCFLAAGLPDEPVLTEESDRVPVGARPCGSTSCPHAGVAGGSEHQTQIWARRGPGAWAVAASGPGLQHPVSMACAPDGHCVLADGNGRAYLVAKARFQSLSLPYPEAILARDCTVTCVGVGARVEGDADPGNPKVFRPLVELGSQRPRPLVLPVKGVLASVSCGGPGPRCMAVGFQVPSTIEPGDLSGLLDLLGTYASPSDLARNLEGTLPPGVTELVASGGPDPPSWQRLAPPDQAGFLTRVACADDGTCTAFGYRAAYLTFAPVTWVSRDWGAHWEQSSLDPRVNGVSELHCSGMLCYGAGSIDVGSGFLPSAAVFLSRDGGRTWSVSLSPGGATFMHSVSCTANGSCLAGGAVATFSGMIVTSRPVLTWTGDFGAHWDELSIPQEASKAYAVIAVACSPAEACWAMAPAGQDWSQGGYVIGVRNASVSAQPLPVQLPSPVFWISCTSWRCQAGDGTDVIDFLG
jgi:hypothetical protein